VNNTLKTRQTPSSTIKTQAKPSISLRAKTSTSEFSIKFSSETNAVDGVVRFIKRATKWVASLLLIGLVGLLTMRFWPALTPTVAHLFSRVLLSK
jgi:hypothetical protein